MHLRSLQMSTAVLCAWVLMDTSLSAQEVLENLKDRWYQADNPPPDLLLTESEFLSFLHPEHSRGMLQFMVKEIIRDLGEAWPRRSAWAGHRLGGLGDCVVAVLGHAETTQTENLVAKPHWLFLLSGLGGPVPTGV